MKETTIAVLSHTVKEFEYYVKDIYLWLPDDKSMVIEPGRLYITIEHPAGCGRKYICIQRIEHLRGIEFDDVEKTKHSYLLKDFGKLYQEAISRTKIETTQ